MLCKAKRQYLLACKASKYCLLGLRVRIAKIGLLSLDSCFGRPNKKKSYVFKAAIGAGALERWFNKATCLESWRSRFLPRSFVKIQYFGEPPCTRESVLGLRQPGLEFRTLCLEGSVISSISPFSAVLLAQFSLYVHESRLKPHSFISFQGTLPTLGTGCTVLCVISRLLSYIIPTNTRACTNASSMLGHYCGRWTSIGSALGQCRVL